MPLGFFGILFVVLLVLKLLGIIAWSWWLVTMPLWIGFVVLVISVVVMTVLDTPKKRR